MPKKTGMSSQILVPRQHRSSSSTDAGSPAGLIFATMALAVLFGLVATTASPIFVSMTAGLLVGVALLAKPSWNIWLVLVLGLLVAGIVPIWADALGSKAIWGISILGFMLMGSALFTVASTPAASRNTPGFVWAALIFMVYAIFSTLAHLYSIEEFITGFKRYFQGFGILFALCWLAIDEIDARRWRKLFVIVALVQLPFALYELVKLVPLREGLRASVPGLVPIDAVAGTFGTTIYAGGASGEMATFLIIILAFMLARRQEKMLPSGRLLLLVPLVLVPLFLGETKVVVILLPMMFLVLYRRELLLRPLYALMGLALGTLLTVAAGMTYLNITNTTLDKQIADTLRYNVYEKGYGGYKLNRTSVLSFWAERQGADDPISLVFGNGLGSSHSATGGHVAMRYPTYGIGLTAVPTLLWDLGILGFALFFAILVLAWRTAGRLRREAAEALVRADAAAIQVSLPMFGFYLFYRLSLLETLSFQIVFAALLGYLAWLYRRHTCSSTTANLQ